MKRSHALMRVIPIVGLCLLAIGSGQVQAQQSDARVDALASEMSTMRRAMAKQEDRLSVLEQAIKELREELRSGTQGADLRSPRPATSAQSRVPWQIPANWDRVKYGMSESQVVAILGQPTSRESAPAGHTFYYRGEVPGSGFVSGNVLIDTVADRVVGVNKPVF